GLERRRREDGEVERRLARRVASEQASSHPATPRPPTKTPMIDAYACEGGSRRRPSRLRLDGMREFKTSDAYRPTGDQPTAIGTLADGLRSEERHQTLVGATGTGKTATMAWTIEQVGKPALVIAHNKTLAAQLCNEFREFFPYNAVEYFVSYY